MLFTVEIYGLGFRSQFLSLFVPQLDLVSISFMVRLKRLALSLVGVVTRRWRGRR